MQKLHKILDKFTSALVGISGSVLVAVALFVIISIIKRAIFGAPIKGTVEIVQYGVMFSIAVALSKTTLLERHTRVTMLTEAMPNLCQKILEAFMKLVSMGVFGVLLNMLVLEVQKAAAKMRVTEIFKIPFTLIYGVLVFSVAVTLVVVLFHFVSATINIFKKDKPPLLEDNSGTDGQVL